MNHDHHDHSDIGCLEAIEGLYALLDGEISDPRTVEQIETHVAHCRSCFSRAQVEQIITEKISQLEQVAEGEGRKAPERLQRKLRNILDKL